jgi:hypothetical protein
MFSVVWPLGPQASKPVVPTTPIPDLSGKRIALIWDWVFRGDEVFEVLKGKLTTTYPGIQFVDHQAFGNILGTDEAKSIAALPDRLRQFQVDAALVGMGC